MKHTRKIIRKAAALFVTAFLLFCTCTSAFRGAEQSFAGPEMSGAASEPESQDIGSAEEQEETVNNPAGEDLSGMMAGQTIQPAEEELQESPASEETDKQDSEITDLLIPEESAPEETGSEVSAPKETVSEEPVSQDPFSDLPDGNVQQEYSPEPDPSEGDCPESAEAVNQEEASVFTKPENEETAEETAEEKAEETGALETSEPEDLSAPDGNPAAEEEAAGSEEEQEGASEDPEEVQTGGDKDREVSREEETGDPETDLYDLGENFDYTIYDGINLTSGRFFVGTWDDSIFIDRSVILSNYRNLYLLQFADEDIAVRAYAYYAQQADFVEADTGIMIAEGEAADIVYTGDVMTAQENPLTELEQAMNAAGSSDPDIALIDTGAYGAFESVSMLGDYAGDDNGHGSSMLNYILEMNPQAKVLSVKALGADGRGNISEVYAAIQYAISRNVRIINLSISSLASPDSELIESAVNEAAAKGILVVGAAGNNGTDASFYIPGGIYGAVVTGACTADGERIASSNYGPTVDYYVAAASTSEAAARYSGYCSLYGTEGVERVLNRGLIFSPGGHYTDIYSEEFRDSLELHTEDTSFVIAEEEYIVINNSGTYDFYAVIDGKNYHAYCYDAGKVSPRGYRYSEIDSDYQAAYGYVMKHGDHETQTGRFIIEWVCDMISGETLDSKAPLLYSDGSPSGEYRDSIRTMATTHQISLADITSLYEAAMAADPGYAGYVRVYTCIDNPNRQRMVVYITDTGSAVFSKTVSEDPGTLTVSKQVEGTADDEEFEFTLYINDAPGKGYVYTGSRSGKTDDQGTFCLKAGESVTISSLPAGAAWKITETSLKTSSGNSKYRTTVTDASGTVKEGNTVSGRIAKASSDQTFSFQVSGITEDSCPYSVYNNVQASGSPVSSGTVKDQGTISLKNGQSVKITEIPEDSVITVTETLPSAADGIWSCDSPGLKRTGTVSRGGTLTLQSFVNRFAPQKQKVLFSNRQGNGFLMIEKHSQWEELCEEHSLYSKKGAVYEVYKEESLAASSLVLTFSTKEDGTTLAAELPAGTYYIAEKTPSAGHLTDPACSYEHPASVQVTAENTQDHPAVFRSTEPVIFQQAVISIIKLSLEDYAYAFPLDHTQFTICCYDNLKGDTSGNPLKTWVIETASDEQGICSCSLDEAQLAEGSDSLYQYAGKTVLPLGTYSIRETLPAPGYTLRGGYMYADALSGEEDRVDTETGELVFLTEEKDGSAVIQCGNQFTAWNHPVILDTTALHISSNQEQVSHYMDAAGKDNVITDLVELNHLEPGASYRLTGQLYLQDTGEKLGEETVYSFTAEAEQENVSMKLTVPKLKTLAGRIIAVGETLEMQRDGTWVKTAQETDLHKEKQTVRIVQIRTTLLDDQTRTKAAVPQETVCRDMVSYTGLVPGETYTLKARLMLKGTDGEELVQAASAEKTFTAQKSSGREEIVFEVNGDPGQTFVAFEELYVQDIPAASHMDPDDEKQTVHIPSIQTELTDRLDNDKDAYAEKGLVLVDHVMYTNLVPGQTYTLKGILVNRLTGEEITDDEGHPAAASCEFVPDSPDGTAEVVFSFPAEQLAGISVTAFEELLCNDVVTAVHADPEDEEQTVYLPAIRTTLHSPDSSEETAEYTVSEDLQGEDSLKEEAAETQIPADHDILAGCQITLLDQVFYENLIPGREYTIKGILMDKESGEPALDDNGSQIESELVFTPEQKNGTEELAFHFDAVSLEGHTLVAFERLYREEKLLAVHCEIEDYDQSGYLPRIRTVLTDAVDGEHDVLADNPMTLVDTVFYENLFPGKEYTVRGILYDKETNIPVSDEQQQQITASCTFVPEEPDGQAEVVFTLDGAFLAGRSVVAMEEVYRENRKVAVHADVTDENQTVYFPAVRTCLQGSGTQEHLVPAADYIRLTDTVACSSLLPGRTYLLEGVLMNRETGEPMKGTDGSELRTQLVFEASSPDSLQKLEFELNGLPEEGVTIVAFETLYRLKETDSSEGGDQERKKVAVHEDLQDSSQTAAVPSVRTVLTSQEGLKIVNPLREIHLTDTVSCQNLLPGITYTLKGRLIYPDSGEAVLDEKGQEVTGNTTFTPSEGAAEETVEFVFTLPQEVLSSLQQELRMTACEALLTGERIVAEHADPEDEAQTVSALRLKTMASFRDGTKKQSSDSVQIITDDISYSGLMPGTYLIRTVLMDPSSGSPVLSGGSAVSAEKTVSLTETKGTIRAELSVPAGTVRGPAVVFEEVYAVTDSGDKVLTGEHKDLKDAAQTVEFFTDGTVVRTGDDTPVTAYLVVLGLAAAVIAGAVVFRLKYKNLFI